MSKIHVIRDNKAQDRHLRAQKIAYILGRFPTLSETFVIREIQELERQGAQVCIFALFKPLSNQGAEVQWSGSAPVTCLAMQSWPLIFLCTLRLLVGKPRQMIHTMSVMIRQYRWQSLVGCRALLFSAFLATRCAQENIFHIHAHFASESAAVAQFTSLLTRIPYSFTAHANDIYLSPRHALACKIRMARFVVTISMYNLHYLTTLVDRAAASRVHCVYNGVAADAFPPYDSGVPRVQEPPRILAICRLVEKKGLHYLLLACRLLVDQRYSFTCHIIGDGPLYNELQQKIQELALSDRVVLVGARTHQQTVAQYAEATILALPCIISRNGDRDGIPTVLIESLYAGVPCVSTTISGVPELITSEVNGLLVPPGDAIALATALARLLDDPALRTRLAYTGYQMVVRQFDLTQNVQRLRTLFCAPHDGLDQSER